MQMSFHTDHHFLPKCQNDSHINNMFLSHMYSNLLSLTAVVLWRTPTGPRTYTSTAARPTRAENAALFPSPVALHPKTRSTSCETDKVVVCFCCLSVCFTFTVFCVQKVINTMCGHGMQELEYLEAGNHIHTNGCIDKLADWIHSNLFLLGGFALGLAIPQVARVANQALRLKLILCHIWWEKRPTVAARCSSLFGVSLLQLVGMLLSQILINQIKDQIELQNYNLKHRTDPWRWSKTRFWWTAAFQQTLMHLVLRWLVKAHGQNRQSVLMGI